MRALLVIAVLGLAGCTDADATDVDADSDGDGFVDAVERKYGSDLDNATSQPDVARSLPVEFSDVVQIVGTGVPSVACPATPANVQTLTWTVTAETGDARESWVTDLVFTVAGEATVNDVDLFVYDPAGVESGAGTSGANTETVTLRGDLPLGEYTMEARGCSGAGDVTVTGSGVVKWIPSDAQLLAA